MPDGKGVGKMGEKGEGIEKHKWLLQKCHEDGKYSIRDTANNILITEYGVRWVQDL